MVLYRGTDAYYLGVGCIYSVLVTLVGAVLWYMCRPFNGHCIC
jgi:hypothetical protein